MSNEIAKVDNALLMSYMETFGVGKKLNQNEKTQFIGIAKAFQLNPFKREIHVVKFKDTLSIITGFEVYLKRAERTGNLDGWFVETSGQVADKSLKAKITIHRKDWSHPFTHEVSFVEYDLGWNLWKTKPVTMLKKVAMAQGFRLAFPDELGGLPYTPEEQWDRGVSDKITEKTEQYNTEPPKVKPVNKPKPKAEPTDKPTEEELIDFQKKAIKDVFGEKADFEEWLKNTTANPERDYPGMMNVKFIKSRKQFNFIKGKFHREFPEQKDLLPERDINE